MLITNVVRTGSRSLKYLALGGLLGTALYVTTPAQAAGFYIQEQSASGLGAAFAGQAAMPRDASTVYYNPSGMTKLDGAQMNVGMHFIQPVSDIDDKGSVLPVALGGGAGNTMPGNDGDNAITLLTVPNISAAYPVEGVLENPIWVGLTVNSPFGLSVDYGEDFIGRYVATKGDLLTMDIAPSLAYQVTDKLSLGGGINIQYANATLEQTLPDLGNDEGLFSLEGFNWEVGMNAGLLFEPIEPLRIGLTYRTAISHDVHGSVNLINAATAGYSNGRYSGKANLDLPAIAQLAAAYDINDEWTVMGGVNWYGWSVFEDIRVEFDANANPLTVIEENFKDTFAFTLGAEYHYDDDWTFRGGFQFDESPTQTSTRSPGIPDADRYWFSLGATYDLNERFSFDIGGTFIELEQETIDRTLSTGAGDIRTDLSYDSQIFIGSLGLNYKF